MLDVELLPHSLLNFAVVELPLAFFCQHVKAHAATVEIVRALLRDDMLHNEIVSSKKDT